jgi:hypothetical protein
VTGARVSFGDDVTLIAVSGPAHKPNATGPSENLAACGGTPPPLSDDEEIVCCDCMRWHPPATLRARSAETMHCRLRSLPRLSREGAD